MLQYLSSKAVLLWRIKWEQEGSISEREGGASCTKRENPDTEVGPKKGLDECKGRGSAPCMSANANFLNADGEMGSLLKRKRVFTK